MRFLVIAAGLLAGCSDIFDLVEVVPTDAGADSSDAVSVDAFVDPNCPYGRYGRYGPGNSGLFDLCLTTPPAPSHLGGGILDTRIAATCSLIVNQGPLTNQTACVIVAEEIAIASDTRAIGDLPLVFVATKTLVISSKLDASSRRGDANGAGNGHSSCATLLIDGESGNSSTPGAGGAGGGFHLQGAKGGDASAGALTGGIPSSDTPAPTFVRGGCRGGAGGIGTQPTGGGGGNGGGALYLIAGTRLTVDATGVIDASGEGGAGGTKGQTGSGGGGGGGGSGGMIGLDAPSIVLAAGARLAANGGGGGGGGASLTGGSGNNGASSDLATYPFLAAGGMGVTAGGYGGDAQRAAGPGENGIDAVAGGGGGGIGYILIYAGSPIMDQGAAVSPGYL
jgi:hypothetical protein